MHIFLVLKVLKVTLNHIKILIFIDSVYCLELSLISISE